MKKEHPLYKGYYVTPCGQIYGRWGRIKKQTINKYGYPTVGIMVDTEDGKVKQKCVTVHRMVAETYISNSHKLATINHINEVKTDNRVENLEWMSSADNMEYSRAKRWLIEEVSTGKVFEVFNLSKFCKQNNYPYTTLYDSHIERRWHKGQNKYRLISRLD